MGGNPFGLILSIGSVRIVVSFTCCDLRRAFLFSRYALSEKAIRSAEPLKRKVQWILRAAKTFARLDRANDDLSCSVFVFDFGVFSTIALHKHVEL